MLADVISPVDASTLRLAMDGARPFPFCCIDDFLRDDFAREVERSFPSTEEAKRHGVFFDKLNERRKLQVTDPAAFPEALARLSAALASPEWLARLSEITGIPQLLADPTLAGAGMQLMEAGGYLDPHVDFGKLQGRTSYRRLNLLLYFNSDWAPAWGGELELWDPQVSRCEQALAPLQNRCVIFPTTATSYHSVRRVACPRSRARQSFAAYYYTREPSPEWDGGLSTTSFRARPGERLKRYVLMPAGRAVNTLRTAQRWVRRQLAETSTAG